MQIKKCKKCNLEKLLNNFSKKHGTCKNCRKQEYRDKNPYRVCWGCHEKISRDFFIKTDRYCISCHQLREENKKESKRRGQRKYRKNHPDKMKNKINKAYRRKYYGSDPGQLINYRLQACRKRAKDKGLDFELDKKYMLQLYLKQEGKCALTGLLFEFNFNENFSKRPFSLSIDRINSKLGYTKNNVRFICSAVNSALSEYGDNVFDIICQARLQFKNSVSNEICK